MPDLETTTRRGPVDVPKYFRPRPGDCPLWQKIYEAHLVAQTIADMGFELSAPADEEPLKIYSCAAVLARHLHTLLEDGEACRDALREEGGTSHE